MPRSGRFAAVLTATALLFAFAVASAAISDAATPSLTDATLKRTCPPASPPRYYTADEDFFTPGGFVDNANGIQLHLSFKIKNGTLTSADFTPDSDHFALGAAEDIGSNFEVPIGPTPVTVTLNVLDSSDNTVASASVAVNGCPSGLHVDFDGNGRDDLVVFRPSNGNWYAANLTTAPYSSTVHNVVTHFGARGDIPVPADYNGDGLTDYAVFRPSSGNWHFLNGTTVHFGARGDVPVPGFYLDDNTLSLAVFRPSSGNWFIRGLPTVHWGARGDLAAPADFNGDGKEDIIVYRPSSGVWHDRDDSRYTTQWGEPHDIPVPGNYGADGDSPTTHLDAATFRPSNGTWYEQGAVRDQFGTEGDVPVPLDYYGNCSSALVVFRPSSGTWYVAGTGKLRWGTNGDIPIRPVAPCTGTLLILF
jgi:putative transposon-encoded protein